MKIAAAQTKPADGNIAANISAHCRMAALAAENGARLIVFPEMSLTGYQRELAAGLSFTMHDPRLGEIKSLAADRRIIIAAGAPVSIDGQLHIGTFILQPDNSTLLYTKQFLHAGEEAFFTPNDKYNPTPELEHHKISFAICADITNPQHAANAHSTGADIYVAGLFYTPGGITEAYQQLSGYASKYGMNVLMANYTGGSYKYEAAGQSAFWNREGKLAAQLIEGTEGLLIVDTENEHINEHSHTARH